MTDNGSPQPQSPLDMVQPVPVMTGAQKVQTPNGEMILVTLGMPTGATIVFFDVDSARRFAATLRQAASSLLVPPGPTLLKPQ